MTEDSARTVCLVKAFETAAQPGSSWSRADSALAGDRAAQEVGANASDETFIRRRAELAWETITTRQPNLARLKADANWHEWLGWVLVGSALVSGVLVDQVGPDNLINLTSLPLFGLLLWNMAVYALLLAEATGRLSAAKRQHPVRCAGPLPRLSAASAGPLPTRPMHRSGPRTGATGVGFRFRCPRPTSAGCFTWLLPHSPPASSSRSITVASSTSTLLDGRALSSLPRPASCSGM